MNKAKAKQIVSRWMFPTERSSYMGGIEEQPILVKSKDRTVTDINGKEYLDFQSGQMGAAISHQHPRMVAIIEKTLKTMMHASNVMLNIPRLRLHQRLGKLLPKPLQRSLFLVSGSDSIEGAIDLARKATGGVDVLGMHAGLHGSTSYLTRSLSFNWNRHRHSVVAPATSAILAPYCYRCPLKLKFPSCDIQCLTTSLELADANFTSKPAAFIGEPILSAGGVIVPPEGFYKRVQEACHERGMLLILDEAQTGLGKTGKMFGFQHEEGVMPDIIALSKHLGGGLPISAVCTSTKIAQRAVKNGYFATRSHATDPLLCAAGEESLNIIVDENLADRAARIEKRIKGAFRKMAKEYELIGDIRGRGVLLGIELVNDREKKTPANAALKQIAAYALKKGLIFQTRGTRGLQNVIRLVPPMTSTDEEVDRALSILHDAICDVVKGKAKKRRRKKPSTAKKGR
ncbi:MAG TPA: aspartate aminotransferase family protein [Rhodospirillales bacterium]|nr:aspartate aminotransferase family protein [Rhodospirillales bacterium]HIM41362.1 aspartate aminotransferase family protein [Rhodospirillales bacterium]